VKKKNPRDWRTGGAPGVTLSGEFCFQYRDSFFAMGQEGESFDEAKLRIRKRATKACQHVRGGKFTSFGQRGKAPEDDGGEAPATGGTLLGGKDGKVG